MPLPAPSSEETLCCPLCNYNLTGLATPRCPECGYAFDWQRLAEARRNRHPYLFEHHGTLHSFFATAWSGLRPGRFWSSLHAGHELRPGRMVLYWLTAMAVSLNSLVIEYVVAIVSVVTLYAPRYRNTTFLQRVMMLKPWGVKTVYGVVRYDETMAALLLITAANVLWPWLTLATLQIFAQSMRKARIRPAHTLRCVTYAFDASIWGTLLFCPLAIAFVAMRRGPLASYPNHTLIPLLGISLACYLWNVMRLYVAYKRYLQFDHPVATILTSQVIATLFCAAVYKLVHGW